MAEAKDYEAIPEVPSTVQELEKYIREQAPKEKDPVFAAMFELALARYPLARKLPEKERQQQEALAGAKFIKNLVEKALTLSPEESLDYLREVFWYYTLWDCILPAYDVHNHFFPGDCGFSEYFLSQCKGALGQPKNEDENEKVKERVANFSYQWPRNGKIRESYENFSRHILNLRDEMAQGVIGELFFCHLAKTAGLEFKPATPEQDTRGVDYFLTLDGEEIEIQIKTKNKPDSDVPPLERLGERRICINFLAIPLPFKIEDEENLRDLLNPSPKLAKEFFDKIRKLIKKGQITGQRQRHALKPTSVPRYVQS